MLIAWGVLTLMSGNFIGGLWRILIGMFLSEAARASYQRMMVRQALEGESVQRFMQSEPRHRAAHSHDTGTRR